MTVGLIASAICVNGITFPPTEQRPYWTVSRILSKAPSKTKSLQAKQKTDPSIIRHPIKKDNRQLYLTLGTIFIK